MLCFKEPEQIINLPSPQQGQTNQRKRTEIQNPMLRIHINLEHFIISPRQLDNIL